MGFFRHIDYLSMSVLVVTGTGLLVFARPVRLMIIGAVLVIGAALVEVDRRAERRHRAQMRRQARYADIVGVLARSAGNVSEQHPAAPAGTAVTRDDPSRSGQAGIVS